MQWDDNLIYKHNKMLVVWECCFNDHLYSLNNTIRIYIIFFHSYVFLQHLNNIVNNLLSNEP